MLTLQAQHVPAISPTLFNSSSSSSSGPATSGGLSASPFPMADSAASPSSSPSPLPRPPRSSRPLLPSGTSSSPLASSSSLAPFPKFHLGETPGHSPQMTPALSTSASRLRYTEVWNDQENTSVSNIVPEMLLTSRPRPEQFLDTFRAAPRAVAAVVGFLYSSHEVLTFCHASKVFRTLVETFFEQHDEVKDAFLARTIAGYQPSTSSRPSWLNRALSIDLTDMDLLLESMSVSLAIYPMHALRVVTSSQSSASSVDDGEKDGATARFQTLTLTHSRFVAYLRNRTAPQALQMASQDEDDVMLPSPDSTSGGLPELIFPSPLYYFKDVDPPVIPAYLPLPESPVVENPRHRSLSKAPKRENTRLSKSKSSPSIHPREPEPSEQGSKSRMKRLSLKPKKKGGAASPPPSAMPALPTTMATTPLDMSQFGSLGHSAGQSMSQSLGVRSRSQSTLPPPPPIPHTVGHSQHSSYVRYTPPSTAQYTPPGTASGWNTPPPPIPFGGKSSPIPPGSTSRRRKARQSLHTPDLSSSSGQFRQSQSLNRSMPFLPWTSGGGTSSGRATPMMGQDISPVSPIGDIHALSQVFRLTRAPIFRVFVPCSQLNQGVRQACMAQLHAASLIPHLRAGDLVCNLGYVPDPGMEDASTTEGGDAGDGRGWMIFSGHELRPLSTKEVIPVRDPTFLLTTPHYYSHVLMAEQNPRFEMAIPLAPPQTSFEPAFSLVRDIRSVVAPKKSVQVGEGIIAEQKKHKIAHFVWTMRVQCARWGHEWILEAEGTKEGRECLETVLGESMDGLERQWELVRERTARGRVYVRRV